MRATIHISDGIDGMDFKLEQEAQHHKDPDMGGQFVLEGPCLGNTVCLTRLDLQFLAESILKILEGVRQ